MIERGDVDAELAKSMDKVFRAELQDRLNLIKQKAIFFVLLLSLFFEWALRKRLGTH